MKLFVRNSLGSWLRLSAALLFLATALLHAQDLTGIWQGTLKTPDRDLRLQLHVEKADAAYKGKFYSIDQSPNPFPTGPITLEGGKFTIPIPAIGGKYSGSFAPDTLTGDFVQGDKPLPLILKKVTAETAWPLPAKVERQPPMDPKADPSFDISTVKPSQPDKPGSMLTVQQGKLVTRNLSVKGLIVFAWELQPKQLIGGPAWLEEEKFDITAKPDTPGMPNEKQFKSMVRKLVQERFKFKFHEEQKELPAYVMTVLKSGNKMTVNEGGGDFPGFSGRGPGSIAVFNTTMLQFAQFLQSGILDRPVVDKTELTKKYDFTLKWQPDETQLNGRTPPPTDSTETFPTFMTAVQEQLGLKFESTKAPVKVLVIDQVEKPEEN